MVMFLRLAGILVYQEKHRTSGKEIMRLMGNPLFINSKPCPQNPKLRISSVIEEKIIHKGENITRASSEFLGIYIGIIISKYPQLEYGMYLNVMDLINFRIIKGSGQWSNLSATKSRCLDIESKLM